MRVIHLGVAATLLWASEVVAQPSNIDTSGGAPLSSDPAPDGPLPVPPPPPAAAADAPSSAISDPGLASDTTSAPEDEAILGAARQLFLAASSAFGREQYDDASRLFRAAYELKPHRDVLMNLALSEAAAGQYASAANHWSDFLSNASTPEKARAEQKLATIRDRIGRLRILARKGQPVRVDYRAVGKAPLPSPVYVEPGKHVVAAGAEQRTVNVAAGAAQRLSFLEPAGPEGETPGPISDTVEHEDFLSWVADTQGAWVLLGISAAGLVSASYASVNAGRSADAREDAQGQINEQWELDGAPNRSPCSPPTLNAEYARACDVLKEQTELADDWRTGAWISLGVGLSAAVATGVYYFVDRDPISDAPKVGFVPVLTPTFQGLGMVSSF